MNRRISLNDYVAMGILILYFAELVFPKLNTVVSYSIVCLGCMILWLFISFTIDRRYYSKTSVVVLLSIFILLVIIPYVFGYPVIAHRYANMALVVCGSIIYNFYYSHDKLYQLRKVLQVTMVLAFITMVNTYIALIENPYISRSIKSSGEYSAELARQGIGGYSFVYFITALCIPLLYMTIRSKDSKKKIGSLLFYLFCVAFVIKSNYMTAFLTVLLSSVVLVFLYLIHKKKNGILGAFIFALAILFVGINIDTILFEISSFLPSRIASVLISGIGESIAESIANEFFGDRWPVMQTSINALLQHPIIGLLGSGELDYNGISLSGFGQHSYILDTFALYGLGAGILNLIALKKPFKNRTKHETDRFFDVAMALSVFMIYLLNNATESIALVVTILYPYIRNLIAIEKDLTTE